MPSTVVVTRTTHLTSTTGTTSAILLNTGFFKTLPGILKLLQLILGSVCIGIMGYYWKDRFFADDVDLFFFLMITTFMIGTCLIIISCFISIGTASILPKTVFDYIYHGFAFLLLLIAGIAFLSELLNRKDTSIRRVKIQEVGYDGKVASAVICLVNAALYLVSTVLAYRTYRRG